MARKVLISFLGTNNYIDANYYFKDHQVQGVRFIQEALLRIFAKDWTADDKLLVFLTEDAYRKNWVDDGHMGKHGPIEVEGLKSRLDALKNEGFEVTITPIFGIPEGLVEKDIWTIFNKVFDSLEEDDEVMIDITHGFRSIPMLSIVLMNYSKFLKNIRMKGIYYGAFETLGPAFKVRELPMEHRNAPIVDLTNFSVLQDWATASYDFATNGKADFIEKLALERAIPALKQTGGQDEAARNMRDLAKAIRQMVTELGTCRGNEIYEGNQAMKVKKLLGSIQQDYIEPFKPLLKRVEDAVDALDKPNEITNGLHAVDWCLRNGLIQQAYSLLLEFVITYLMLQLNEDIRDVPTREVFASALRIHAMEIPEAQWQGHIARRKELARKILAHPKTQALSKEYNSLADYRNDIMHAGFASNSRFAEKFLKHIQASYEKIKKTITE